jgi:DNA-binding beta-propeller fold protein YncE
LPSDNRLPAAFGTTLVLLAILGAAPAAAQDWPVWRGEPGRTGLQSEPGAIVSPAVTATLLVGGAPGAGELLAQDVDLDGLPETVFARGGRALALRPDGTAAWASAGIGAVRPLGAADLDGDGRPEVVVATAEPGIAVLDGTTGALIFATPAGEIPVLGTVLPVPGDTLRLYVADDGCANDGAGTGRVIDFGAAGEPAITPLRTETHGIWCGRNHAAADVDGDGDPEIVAPDDDRVWAYATDDGFSAFASGHLGSFPWGLVDVAPADLDADGDDELVLASNNAYRWVSTSRRLLVLDAEEDDLVVRWHVDVDPGSGRHGYIDAPAAEVLADVPGLEVVSSFAASAEAGWALRVFRGLPSEDRAEVLAELPGHVALGLADLDGDTISEILAQPATTLDVVSPGPVAAFRAAGDGTLTALWTSSDSWLPLAPSSGDSAAAADAPRALGGWGSPDRPIVLAGPSGHPALVLERDGDADGIADRVALVDGPTGEDLADYAPASAGITAIARASGGAAVLAVATDDGRVALLDAELDLSNDLDGDGAPDVFAGRGMPQPIVVSRPGETPATLAVDSRGRLVEYHPADPPAGDGTEASPPDARSTTRLLGGAGAPVSGSACDCPAGTLIAAPVTGADGQPALALFGDVAAAPQATFGLASGMSFVWDPLPIGDADPAAPGWDVVAVAQIDWRGERAGLALANTGGGWVRMCEQVDEPVDAPLSAADLDGDGVNEVLAVHRSFRRAVDFEGVEVARGDGTGGGLIAARDVDGDGAVDLFRTGAAGSGPERLDAGLERLWIAAAGTSHDDRYGALAPGRTGTWRIAAVPAGSAEVTAYLATDGGAFWTGAYAGGAVYASTAEAIAEGAAPGALSNIAAAADLAGDGLAAFVAGSTDGWVYAFAADDGALLWAAPLHEAAGEPIVARVAGDAGVQVVVPTADGLLHVIDAATLVPPGPVLDADGAAWPASEADEVDVTYDATTVAAAWPPVDGADGYLVAVATGDGILVRPWALDVEPRLVARDLRLQPGTPYRTVVRAAVGGRGASPEASSDGFTVVDDDPPSAAVDATPGRVLPDADGVDDASAIRVSLGDAVGLRRFRLEVVDPSGATLLTLAEAEIGGVRREVSTTWNGRGPDGRVVTGARYRAVAFAEDTAGRSGGGEAAIWVCAGEALAEPECAEAGEDAGADAGPTDAAGDAAAGGSGGGCSCGLAGADGGLSVVAPALLLAVLAGARRRTRARARRSPP